MPLKRMPTVWLLPSNTSSRSVLVSDIPPVARSSASSELADTRDSKTDGGALVGVMVTVGVLVGVLVRVGVLVGVSVGVWEGVAVTVNVGEGVAVAVSVGV